MASGFERDLHGAERNGFAVTRGLAGAGEVFTAADRHDRERFGRRQDGAVAGAGMVGVAVGDDGALHRLHRIDEEIAVGTVKTAGLWFEQRSCHHRTIVGRNYGQHLATCPFANAQNRRI